MIGSVESLLNNALKSGEEWRIKEAFETIYNEYCRLVAFSISKYITDVETVKDLTNEVFLNFFNNANEIHSNIKSFLCTMGKNTAINHAKKQSRMVYTDQEDAIPSVESSSCQSAAYYTDIMNDLEAILSKKEVQIIQMHVVEGYPFDIIAEQLGITANNATVIYHRALKKFRSSSRGKKYEKR